MSGDVVERLRGYQRDPEMSDDDLGICNEAADLLDAIDALHQPEAQFDREWCCVCFTEPWPCKTHSLLHPEGKQ